MSSIYLFVEGKTDRDFVNALIKRHIKFEDYQIFILNGNHARIREKSDRLKEGKHNLFILDSDANTLEDVANSIDPLVKEEKLEKREISYDTHLIENDLEHLIRGICPDDKQDLWDCINAYANCNCAIKSEALREVDLKSKVYIYVNAHKVPENYKGREYQNNNLWDLNHHLPKPLVKFLRKHLEDEV